MRFHSRQKSIPTGCFGLWLCKNGPCLLSETTQNHSLCFCIWLLALIPFQVIADVCAKESVIVIDWLGWRVFHRSLCSEVDAHFSLFFHSGPVSLHRLIDFSTSSLKASLLSVEISPATVALPHDFLNPDWVWGWSEIIGKTERSSRGRTSWWHPRAGGEWVWRSDVVETDNLAPVHQEIQDPEAVRC